MAVKLMDCLNPLQVENMFSLIVTELLSKTMKTELTDVSQWALFPNSLFTEDGYGGLCILYLQVALISGSLASMRPLTRRSISVHKGYIRSMPNAPVRWLSVTSHLYKMTRNQWSLCP